MVAFKRIVSALVCATAVSAHGLIVAVTGENGVVGMGYGARGHDIFGPGSHDPFYYTARWLKSKPSVCGLNRHTFGTQTFVIDWKKYQREEAEEFGVPQFKHGVVHATWFQLNHDGAGGFTCEYTTENSAKHWTPAKVIKNVPGSSGGLSNNILTKFPLDIAIPKHIDCKIGTGYCMMRCHNPNVNPFGACFNFST